MIRKFFDGLGKCEELATIFLMWAAFLIVLAHIICRYIFGYPLYFAEEISRYAFIYVIMIGASVVLRRRAHTRVEYFVNFLPLRGRYFLNGLMGLVIIYFLIYLVYYGTYLTKKTMTIPTAAMNWPWGLIYLAAPIGGVLMLIPAVGHTIDDFKQALMPARADED